MARQSDSKRRRKEEAFVTSSLCECVPDLHVQEPPASTGSTRDEEKKRARVNVRAQTKRCKHFWTAGHGSSRAHADTHAQKHKHLDVSLCCERCVQGHHLGRAIT